jgi:hypothetical protein
MGGSAEFFLRRGGWSGAGASTSQLEQGARMDVRCEVCGEPWSLDTIHEEVLMRTRAGEKATYQTVVAEFRAVGCKAQSARSGQTIARAATVGRRPSTRRFRRCTTSTATTWTVRPPVSKTSN